MSQYLLIDYQWQGPKRTVRGGHGTTAPKFTGIPANPLPNAQPSTGNSISKERREGINAAECETKSQGIHVIMTLTRDQEQNETEVEIIDFRVGTSHFAARREIYLLAATRQAGSLVQLFR